MSGFLGFVMRSRLSAIGIVALGAVMPLLFWLSGAVIALVTLRRGIAEGLLITGGAAAVLLPLYGLAVGSPMAILQPIALLWVPVLALAQILRQTVSLAATLQLAGVLAGLGVLAFYGLHGDPAEFWQGTLQALADVFSAGSPGPEWQLAAEQLAPRLTGLWIANMLGIVLLCLLLGRWWQALLYNPGGFREEFHSLRLTRWFAVLVLALVVGSMVTPPGIVSDLASVMGAVFLLQTLAVMHAIAAMRGWHVGWLIGAYLILPLMLRPAALLGLADSFVDFRARAASRA